MDCMAQLFALYIYIHLTMSSMTADGSYVAMSNLALKGITGIYAMGKINQALEPRGAEPSKTLHYLASSTSLRIPHILCHYAPLGTLLQNTANTYAQQWQKKALSSDHVKATYGSNETWAMLYNLYAPRLIGADIIPENVGPDLISWELLITLYTERFTKCRHLGMPNRVTQVCPSFEDTSAHQLSV